MILVKILCFFGMHTWGSWTPTWSGSVAVENIPTHQHRNCYRCGLTQYRGVSQYDGH